jgi:hypothetical protein
LEENRMNRFILAGVVALVVILGYPADLEAG